MWGEHLPYPIGNSHSHGTFSTSMISNDFYIKVLARCPQIGDPVAY